MPMRSRFPALLLVFAMIAVPLRGQLAAPHVRIGQGELEGEVSTIGPLTFRGIPYAAPPVGDLRWREPKAAAGWTGVRDATKSGAVCMQPETQLFGIPRSAMSEDCLYLNVWTPSFTPTVPAPVMVFIHGGSFITGSGSQPQYDGANLANRGVVVVTINYRLGILGFLAHPDLTVESPRHTSGNYGLLDQLAALRWVRENIAAFGGDPRNVTLFGESAGSIDAGALVTSPLAAGLFQRVIIESGPPFGLGVAPTLGQAEAVGTALGKAAPGHSTSTLENLRSLPATQVVELAHQTVKTQFKGFDPFAPLVDGWVLPQSASKAFGSGTIQKVDLLAGLNGRELSAFRVAAAMAAKQNAAQGKGGGAGEAVKKLADTARPLYGGWTDAAIGLYLVEILMHHDVAIDQASNDI